ncbi:hypothetical protein HYT32_01610 [Candidatus Roizmanbacteria bacterium]|nr:hypothetical protein [Candidatus Roizmanbacteria bacterium]
MGNETSQNQAPIEQTTTHVPRSVSPSRSPFINASIIVLALITVIIASTWAYLALKPSNTPAQNISQTTPYSPTPTPDPTANWKTYTNTEYSFELKYPPIFTDGQISSNLKYQGINLANLSNGEANNLTINIYPSLKNYRLVDNSGGFIFYFDINSKQWMHDKTTETSKFAPQKTNNFIESYSYKTGDVKCTQGLILIPNFDNNFLIELINEVCRDDNGTYLPGYYDLTIAEILSTFKFTDQDQVNTPSITVLSPNGGEILKTGETYIIKWKSSGVENIYFNLVSGGKEFATTGPISASVGQYNWIVPDMLGYTKNNFKIFIHNNSATNDARDYSDETFTIE